jgi:hypothetical protein
MVVRIQCFSFDLRGEAARQSVTRDKTETTNSSMTLWEGNIIQRISVVTLTAGHAAPRGGG